MTHIEQFIKNHPTDWRQVISAAPYNIKIKEEDGKVLLKYNQLAADTDWYSPLVRECRGIILDAKTNEVICHAFDRFYNYGEPYAADIDWYSAVATEKIDGSIIKVYYDKEDNLCISTNGSINAFKTPISSFVGGQGGTTFGDKVLKCLAKAFTDYGLPSIANTSSVANAFEKELRAGNTAIFELVSPENQVVIYYDTDELYYLGSRNVKTNEEYRSDFMSKVFKTPTLYNIADMSIKEILAFVDSMKGKEGIVVCDKYYNRVKIKNAEYLLRHRTMKSFTDGDVLDIVLSGESGEWAATVPKFQERIAEMKRAYDKIMENLEQITSTAKEKCKTDKEWAEYFFSFGKTYASLLFAYRNGKQLPKRILLTAIKEF